MHDLLYADIRNNDELVSIAILSLPLNQVRQLSLTGESMCCFVLINCLGGIRMPGNSVCRLTDHVRHDRKNCLFGCKTSIKQKPYILMN